MKRNHYLIIGLLVVLVVLAGIVIGHFWPKAAPGEPNGSGEGTLDLYGIDPYTLDPAASGDATSHEYITQLFSGLIRLDDDLEVVPDIATDWSISDDGLTYTFHLREDVYFHDGRQLTAADFEYSWQRALSPSLASQTAPTYLGDIQGAQDVLEGRTDELSGARATGDYTLEVTIEQPRSYFLYKLAYPTAFAVDPDTTQDPEWWRSTVNGTGPFYLKSWTEGSLLELGRNPNYYGEAARLESVVYHLWAGVVMELYETGEIDVASVGVSYIDMVRDEKNVFLDELVEAPSLSLMYIGFDCTSEPFNDPLVRRAFARAVDRQKIVDLVFKDTVIEAEGVLPPGMPGYNDAIQGTEFDPQAALADIAVSSYGSVENLPPTTVTTAGYGGAISSELEAVVYQWEQNLGIRVTVRQIEPNDFYYSLDTEKDQMFYFGWGADYPHPQNFLEVLFGQGSPNNTGEYYSSQFQGLIEQAAGEADLDTSFELYRQAEQILIDDTALIPILFDEQQVLVKPYVKGYEINPLGVVALNHVWLED